MGGGHQASGSVDTAVGCRLGHNLDIRLVAWGRGGRRPGECSPASGSPAYGLLLWVLTLCTVISTTLQGVAVQEFCQWETLNASCGPGEAIVMETALYGRMRLGRCVRIAYGNIGCLDNVLDLADWKCSGKQHCTIVVADIALQGFQPCPGDFTAYLEASYSCVKVLQLPESRGECQTRGHVTVTAPSGYLSPDLTDAGTSQLSSASCHKWVIQGAPGQVVNITILDFSRHSESLGSSERQDSVLCQRLVLIRDVEGGKETNVCGGRHRVRNVYLSDSRQVEVTVYARAQEDRNYQFLLYYDVIGCVLPPLPEGTTVRGTADQLTIYCNSSGETWQLRCVDSRWVGSIGNCSARGPMGSHWNFLQNDWTSPYGLLLVISLGTVLGIAIGITLLAIVLCVMKRKQKAQTLRHQPAYAGDLYGEEYTDPPSSALSLARNPNKFVGDYTDMLRAQIDENNQPMVDVERRDVRGYQTMAMQSPPGGPLEPGLICPTGGAGKSGQFQHIYESPKC